MSFQYKGTHYRFIVTRNPAQLLLIEHPYGSAERGQVERVSYYDKNFVNIPGFDSTRHFGLRAWGHLEELAMKLYKDGYVDTFFAGKCPGVRYADDGSGDLIVELTEKALPLVINQ